MCCRESDYPDGVDQHCLEREVEVMVKTPPNSEEVVQEFLLQLVGFVPEYDWLLIIRVCGVNSESLFLH